MHATQQADNEQKSTPQKEVEVLWSERRRKLNDELTILLIVCNIPLLLIYWLLVLVCTEPGGMLPEEAEKLLIFPAISALCLLLIVGHMLCNYRTVYVLTRSHAHIIIHYPLAGRITNSTRITQNMVFEVKRRKNGSADYMLMQQHIGRLTIPTGFIGVQNVAEFEHQLKRCGVQLPSSDQATPTPPPSCKKLAIFALIPLLILGNTLYRLQTSEELQLDVLGQPATATVVDYDVQAKTEGGKVRKAVTRYHPVLRFSTADGTLTQAIDRLGDKRPLHELHSQVDIIYLPHNPGVAERASCLRYVKPGLILLFFLGSLAALVYQLRRRLRYRKQSTPS